LLNKTTVTDCG